MSQNGLKRATIGHNEPQWAKTNQSKSKLSANNSQEMDYNEPKWAKMSLSKDKWATKSQNGWQRAMITNTSNNEQPKMEHNDPS